MLTFEVNGDLSYFEDIFNLYTNGEKVFETNRNIQLNYVHTYYLFLQPSNENILEVITIKSPVVQNIQITATVSIGMLTRRVSLKKFSNGFFRKF